MRIEMMKWTAFTLLASALPALGQSPSGPLGNERFQLVGVHESGIVEIHEAMKSGDLSCRSLVQMYLGRIEAYDKKGPSLNAIVTVNPRALERAAKLQARFNKDGITGPLHCIPVIVKDNYDTADLPTTAGSVSLARSQPPDDAFLVRRIREAGGIVLAKSNMAEFAFSPYETLSSILPGHTRNPYDLRRVPAGSSGGTAAAVAASFGAVGLGTDTGNSIRGPSSHTALVGVRPTLGLTSRDGIVPLNLYRDVGGPMARSVADAVAVLDAVAGYDPADPVTAASRENKPRSYLPHLRRDGLKGARIGVLRALFETETADPDVVRLFEYALDDMRGQGAVIVDPITISTLTEIPSSKLWCRPFKFHLNQYLASLGPSAPVKTLKEILKSNKFHPSIRKRLEDAQAIERSPEQGLCQAAQDGNNSPLLSPHTEFPAITVPMGFTRDGLPAGIQFLGDAWSEPTLIRIAHAYEQATRHRRPPRGFY
jgi:Asp-tRNA(Asn)/Glu-tRNA(Gln) amidotransferase A subunit family amidase